MKFAYAPGSRPLPGYTIKRAIDRGGFGEVYYAQSDGGKEVALKLLQHHFDVELRGIRQCLNLNHPHLVSILDVRTDPEGDHWVIMEYLRGETLDAVLARHPQGLPIDEMWAWFDGICGGVEFLHQHGLVHRDLKPSNLYRDGATVKVGDVGLSKFITPSRRSAHTESVGTVHYMAPEVSRGKYGHEVDIYALGVILFEMLTGRLPFEGESTAEILMKHLSAQPDLSPLSPAFRSVVERALRKDPVRRFANVAEMRAAVRQACRAGTTAPALDPIGAGAGRGGGATTWGSEVDHDDVEVEIEYADARETPGPGARPTPNRRGGEPPHLPPDARAEGRGSTARSVPPPLPQPKKSATAHDGSASPRHDRRSKSWSRKLHTHIFLMIFFTIFVVLPMVRGMSSTGPHAGFRLLVVVVGAYWLTFVIVRSIHDAFFVDYRPAGRSPAPHVSQPSPNREPPNRETVRPVVEKPHTEAERDTPTRVGRVIEMSPETVRPQSLFARGVDLASSLTVASLLSVGAGLVLYLLHAMRSPADAQDVAPHVFFALSTLLASWGVLTVAKSYEGTAYSGASRRVMQGVAGIVVGVAVFWLDRQLMMELNEARPLRVGFNETLFLSSSLQLTGVAYATFFGALFGLRKWWWLADSFRPVRFDVWSLVPSVILGALLSGFVPIPGSWSCLWGVTLTLVVQMASTFVPVADRRV